MSSFILLLQLVAFCTSVYIFGKICKLIGVSSIAGEIFAGVLFKYIDQIPFLEFEDLPPIFVLLGTVGVAFILAESGLHFSFNKLRRLGPTVTFTAFLGTIVPFSLGLGFTVALGFPAFPDGLSAGVAMAPTSVLLALPALAEMKVKDSDYGQIIITAAMLDDIFSLVSFVFLMSLGSGSLSVWSVTSPLLFSFSFLGIGTALSYAFFPWIVPKILGLVAINQSSLQPRDELHLFLILAMVMVYGTIGSFIGSPLLGAFLAGMSFCKIRRSGMIWNRQVKRILAWLVRFFFAATVGFAIPVDALLNINAFWRGAILAFGPCVCGELSTALHTKYKLLVGVANIGRGEFSFLVAQTALATKTSDGITMLSNESFAMVVWALIIAVLITPPTFRFLLKKQIASKERCDVSGFRLTVQGHHHLGMLHEVLEALNEHSCDVTSCHTESDGLVDIEVFTIMPRGDTQLDAEKAKQLHHSIIDAVNDPAAHCILEPLYENEDDGISSSESFMQICLLACHDSQTLSNLTIELENLGLQISKAEVGILPSMVDGEVQKERIVFIAKDSCCISGYYTNRVARDARIASVRNSILELLSKFNIKGEVMVKFGSRMNMSEDANCCDADFQVKLKSSASQNSLARMYKLYSDFDMDVKAAFVDRTEDGNYDVFFLKHRHESDAISVQELYHNLAPEAGSDLTVTPIKRLINRPASTGDLQLLNKKIIRNARSANDLSEFSEDAHPVVFEPIPEPEGFSLRHKPVFTDFDVIPEDPAYI